ncbi:hypothetical protein ECZU51_46630 [Escherichia coli]|nr:hypothetical protein ECZU51_46630 [Escherichia coli]
MTIVFDPKGDADLLLRVWAEAHRAGRGDELYIFHLGWPEISARYNAVGRFGRVSEVASRVAGQLSGEGNSAAFREFAAVRQHHFRARWHSVSARTTC